MKYLIYARVSPRGSDFEGETSISMQIQYCREYVKFHGGEVLDVKSDEFVSGKDTNRPAFSGIMAELESGKAEWDTIIVYKLSRMTRSLRDGANIFASLFAQGKGFVSATENLDFSSPAGRAMLGMMQVFNQFEREQGAENVRNKMISIAKQGLWPSGSAPFGYARGNKKDNKLYPDARKASIVRDIFEMYASEKITTRDICCKYKKVLTKSRILSILRDKTYLGKICYANAEYPGAHDPIISQELFDRVQRKLPKPKEHSRPKAYKYPFVLTGLVYCQCGRRMTPGTAKSGAYAYYTCTDTLDCKTRVSAPKLEKAALDFLGQLDIRDEVFAATLRKIEEKRDMTIKEIQPEIARLKKAISEANTERERIFSVLTAGNLNDEIKQMANEKMEHISSELTTLKTRLAIYEQETSSDTDIYHFAMDLLKQTKRLSKDLSEINDPDIQRRLLLSQLQKIQALGNDEYQIYPAYTESSTKGIKWYTGWDSNPHV
ncbi:MAG: recombinase family protein [Victivallales bacterium]|nr:recombinase family protein [Victivallales bacterium]